MKAEYVDSRGPTTHTKQQKHQHEQKSTAPADLGPADHKQRCLSAVLSTPCASCASQSTAGYKYRVLK